MALSEKSLQAEAVWEAKASRWHSESCARAWMRAGLSALHSCYFSAVPCLHNQTDTNKRGKYICYAESLIFYPISEKHLWALSPKWNNCVNGISKVTLSQLTQENRVLLFHFLLLSMPVRFACTKKALPCLITFLQSPEREEILSVFCNMGLESFFHCLQCSAVKYLNTCRQLYLFTEDYD